MTKTQAIPVDPSNTAALEAWDGDDGAYWSEYEDVFDRSLHRYRRSFVDAASIASTHRVLDIGCGTGETTRDAARVALSGSALGVDLSARMLDLARKRAAEQAIGNARFLQADAQVHSFDEASFDVAISRTGAMFFGDPVVAFANIGRALRDSGRLVLLVWQSVAMNHWVRDFTAALAVGREQPTPPAGAPGPFSLADPARARSILSEAGFGDIAVEGVEKPMWFGATSDDAYTFVRGLGFTEFMLRDLDDRARARALDDLRASIGAHETDEGVLYPSAMWILSAKRA
jgi:SAM-dependent methyltransferase